MQLVQKKTFSTNVIGWMDAFHVYFTKFNHVMVTVKVLTDDMRFRSLLDTCLLNVTVFAMECLIIF